METTENYWRSRIIKYEDADPRTLVPNPDNFKIHPSNQASLMNDIFSEIGWIQNVIVNVRTGHIIDGHMRIAQAIEHNETSVPVTWVDLDPSEEAKAIAMFDPTSQLAKQNREAVLSALSKISTGSDHIKKVLDMIAKRSKLPIERMLKDEDSIVNSAERMFADEVIGKNYRLTCGDCIEIMEQMPENSVDSIIVDMPYNVTQAEWDSQIDLEEMWKHVLRIAKDDTMIVAFSAQPFTTVLIGSNHKMFKYEIIWVKSIPTGKLNSNIRPMCVHENICVFANGAMWYNPQMSKGEEHKLGGSSTSRLYGKVDKIDLTTTDLYYPQDVIYFGKTSHGYGHPTEKPVDLMKYLVLTYSREGETILDFTMGSGTTGVAALETGRKFIGIENNEQFFEIAVERIKKANDTNG